MTIRPAPAWTRIACSPRVWTLLGWALTLVILVVGTIQRLHVPPLAVADPDTWGYFKPALSLLSGQGFLQHYGRDWLYSALVAGGLQLTGSVAGLVRFQQVLGLLSGLLLMVVLRGWARFLPATALREFSVALFGNFALLLFFLRPQTVLFEVQLRPESVWTFFIFVQLLCILAYAHARWVTGRLVRALVFGSLAFALAYAVLLLKPSWAGGAVVTCLPIFFGVLGSRRGLPLRLVTPVVAVLFTLLTLWLPARIFFERDQISEDRLPLALFTIHSKWILASLERKEPTLADGDPEKAFLQKFLPIFRVEFSHTQDGDSVYRQLGYDADYLRYRSPIFQWLHDEAGMSQEQRNAFCYSSFLYAWRTEPLGMLGKFFRELELFVLPEYATFYKKGIDFRDRYETTLEKMPAPKGEFSPEIEALYTRFRSEIEVAARTPRDLPPVMLFQQFARVVSVSLPILVVLAFVGVVLACANPRFSALRLPGALAFLLYLAPGGNAVTVSIIHALDVNRYRLSYAGPLILAWAALAAFVIFLGERLVQSRRNLQKG